MAADRFPDHSAHPAGRGLPLNDARAATAGNPVPLPTPLSGHAECEQGITEILALARRRLLVWAPALDLPVFDRASTHELLTRFAAGGAHNRARFLVQDDVDAVIRHPRLVDLCRRFPPFIEWRVPEIEPLPHARDMLVIADEIAWFRRAHDRAQASLCTRDARTARALALQFGEAWERSSPAAGLTVLGL